MKKRLIPLLLCAVLLTGCFHRKAALLNPVEFFYLQSEFEYGASDGVVSSEFHDAPGHTEDLDYLLQIYFIGPADETLRNPFPEGTRLLSAEQTDDTLRLELTDSCGALSDLDFVLGCTCLSRTAMEILDVTHVTVVSGSRSITTTRDYILTYDDYMPQSTEEML